MLSQPCNNASNECGAFFFRVALLTHARLIQTACDIDVLGNVHNAG